jgi:hypothetical protein
MPVKLERPRAERAVETLYTKLLGRAPEPAIRRGLVDYFTEGRLSVRMQLTKMVKSEEFFDKQLRDKSHVDAANIMYKLLLARPPESDGALKAAADFIGNLGRRVQADVMLNSDEYLDRFGDDRIPFDDR